MAPEPTFSSGFCSLAQSYKKNNFLKRPFVEINQIYSLSAAPEPE